MIVFATDYVFITTHQDTCQLFHNCASPTPITDR